MKKKLQPFRIGFGHDVHALAPGDGLIVGGIKIPATIRSVGHSDADVLIHAICDALLGALALRDIGYHFPDTDNRYKGINSLLLLKETMSKIMERGYEVGNIDTTICLQEPKINPHIPAMTKILAEAMNITQEDISIKATTTEHLGFVGEGAGISAYAIALLEIINP